MTVLARLFRVRAIPGRVLAATVVALAAIAFVPVLLDAILVAPVAVFIDHRTRSGQLFLVNTTATPEEVTIELKFGYPVSDSAGGVNVRLVDQPDSTLPSAAGWVRAFPRRTVVQPGERQVVRLLAQPPLDLADGEYWSRIIVTSHEVRPAPTAAADSTVRAGVNVELRQILSLSYRKGPVHTGLTLTEFQPQMARDSAVAWIGLQREGNAAFLGSVQLEVHDQAGRVIGQYEAPLAVFVAVRRRFAIPLTSPAGPGAYTVRFRITTQRADLKPSDVLPTPPLADSAVVRVSG